MIGAGFLLMKSVRRDDDRSPELLPTQLLSASSCISRHFPGTYAMSWCQDDEAARAKGFDEIGLPVPLRAEATEWATKQFDKSFGWVATFFELADAIAIRDRFFAGDPDIIVAGLGLPDQYVAAFLEDAAPPPTLPGFAPMGASGYFQAASRNQPVEPNGELLGFELLVTDAGRLDCSWLCNSIEVHCFRELGIRPAANGLLPDLETAERCLAEITNESVGAEPGLWLPWAIYKYA
jgi:hypothetical protein